MRRKLCKCRLGGDGKRSGQSVFGKKLHPAQNHNQKAYRIADRRDRGSPRFVWQYLLQQRFGQQRSTDRHARAQARPEQRPGWSLKLILAFSPDNFVHDMGINGRAGAGLIFLVVAEFDSAFTVAIFRWMRLSTMGFFALRLVPVVARLGRSVFLVRLFCHTHTLA